MKIDGRNIQGDLQFSSRRIVSRYCADVHFYGNMLFTPLWGT